jgi:phosphoribosylaminoimidazole (AIR) synthetase
MNKGRALNNGEHYNGFSVVRRPANAVENAAPSAKRILSGMVTPTQIGLIVKTFMQCLGYGRSGL